MTRKEKADFEYRAVRELLRIRRDLPVRRCRPSPKPEVDVLVARTDDAIIGVEVSELHPSGGQLARQREATQDTVLRKAQTLYEATDRPSLEVVVFWSPYVDPLKVAQKELAQQIVDFVVNYVPDEDEAVEYDETLDATPTLPPAVHRIAIRRFVGLPSHWYSPRSGFPGELTIAPVLERVAAKEPKVRRYKNNYAEVWLLLVLGASGQSTWANLNPELARVELASSFDRGFVLHSGVGAVELTFRRVV